MNFDTSSKELVLTEEETRIAIAMLGDNNTGQELKSLITTRILDRMVLRIGIGNYTNQNPDELLRVETPEHFEYRLPVKHRVPLIGAFTLAAAENQGLSQTDILLGLEDEQIRSLASTARDNLLQMQ